MLGQVSSSSLCELLAQAELPVYRAFLFLHFVGAWPRSVLLVAILHVEDIRWPLLGHEVCRELELFLRFEVRVRDVVGVWCRRRQACTVLIQVKDAVESRLPHL